MSFNTMLSSSLDKFHQMLQMSLCGPNKTTSTRKKLAKFPYMIRNGSLKCAYCM